jgi:hypothetical protein
MSDVQAETIEAQGPWPAGHYQDAAGRHWLHQIHNGSAYGAPDRDVDQWLNYRGRIANPPLDELVRLVRVAAGVLVDDHNDDRIAVEAAVRYPMPYARFAVRPLTGVQITEMRREAYSAGRRSAVVPETDARINAALKIWNQANARVLAREAGPGMFSGESSKLPLADAADRMRDALIGAAVVPESNDDARNETTDELLASDDGGLSDRRDHDRFEEAKREFKGQPWDYLLTLTRENAMILAFCDGWNRHKRLTAPVPSTDHSALTRVDYSKAPSYLIALRDRETWADGYNAAVAALEGGTR